MKAALSRAVLAHQRPLEALKPRGRRVGMAVDQRVKRLEQHLAVARSAETPAGVAEGHVLAPVGLDAELIAGQPYGRAQALEALARFVDRRAEVLVGSALEPLARHVELPVGNAANSLRHPLAITQPKPALVLPGTVSILDASVSEVSPARTPSSWSAPTAPTSPNTADNKAERDAG